MGIRKIQVIINPAAGQNEPVLNELNQIRTYAVERNLSSVTLKI
jgi:hypothetical protein